MCIRESDLIGNLSLRRKDISIEGLDISHHGGQDAIGSIVRFSKSGPEKSKYKLFNIPKQFSGNDIGSIKNVLERRINKASINPLPDIILIDGGKIQLKAALTTFSALSKNPPMILSIVKGSKNGTPSEFICNEVLGGREDTVRVTRIYNGKRHKPDYQ